MPERRQAAPTYDDTSAFLNCPFDAAYAPLFEAIIFALPDVVLPHRLQ